MEKLRFPPLLPCYFPIWQLTTWRKEGFSRLWRDRGRHLRASLPENSPSQIRSLASARPFKGIEACLLVHSTLGVKTAGKSPSLVLPLTRQVDVFLRLVQGSL